MRELKKLNTLDWKILILFLLLPAPGWAQNSASRRPFKLVANTLAFWDLVGHDAKMETMATGFGFTEGPVWDKSGFLWVSDGVLNKIFRVYPDGHHEEMISLGDPDGSTY